jgi:hypothetical protein
MDENEFILKLQARAREQEQVVRDMPLSKVFSTVSLWLGNHPWRIIIPLAFLLTLLFRGVFGGDYTDFVLALFRKI